MSRGCWKAQSENLRSIQRFAFSPLASALFHPPVATDASNLDENQEVLVIKE